MNKQSPKFWSYAEQQINYRMTAFGIANPEDRDDYRQEVLIRLHKIDINFECGWKSFIQIKITGYIKNFIKCNSTRVKLNQRIHRDQDEVLFNKPSISDIIDSKRIQTMCKEIPALEILILNKMWGYSIPIVSWIMKKNQSVVRKEINDLIEKLYSHSDIHPYSEVIDSLGLSEHLSDKGIEFKKNSIKKTPRGLQLLLFNNEELGESRDPNATHEMEIAL